jgi:hypothetical protein
MKKLIRYIGSQGLITLILVGAIWAAGFQAVQNITLDKSEDRSKAIETVLLQAAVQCYALEGSYPPGLDYLQNHYGILLDEAQYYYFYDVQGANLVPKIAVIKR